MFSIRLVYARFTAYILQTCGALPYSRGACVCVCASIYFQEKKKRGNNEIITHICSRITTHSSRQAHARVYFINAVKDENDEHIKSVCYFRYEYITCAFILVHLLLL